MICHQAQHTQTSQDKQRKHKQTMQVCEADYPNIWIAVDVMEQCDAILGF
jgi:hypothetical protein